MKIEDIEITQSTLNKIWSKHGVNVKEIFEVFWNKGNKPKFRKSKKGSYYRDIVAPIYLTFPSSFEMKF
jgi:uncharacterized protein YcnI